jgi:membrane-associated phospholipid phosphatase
MFELDVLIYNAVNSLGDGFYILMKSLSEIGKDTTYFAIIVILIWCIDFHRFSKLTLLVPFSGLMSESLKVLFHLQRPWHILEKVKQIDSFGMPSGHALSAVVFWLTIANTLKKGIVWILSILMIVGIGISRIYRDSHFPSQVLAGFVFGIILLIGLGLFEQYGKVRFFNFDKSLQIAITIAIPMVFVLIAIISYILYHDGNGLENISSAFQLAGLFIGFAVGLNNARKLGRLNMKVDWWKQLIKLALCGVSFSLYPLLLNYSCKITNIIWIEGLLTITISFFAGMWFIYYAPIIFKKFSLCNSIE